MSAVDTQALLRQRAADLARPVAEGPRTGGTDVLVVSLAGLGQYAVDARSVRHVLRNDGLCRLPAGSQELVGVTVVGGKAVPVADLASVVAAAEPRRDRPFLVAFDSGVGPLGVLVDHIVGVVTARDAELSPLPPSYDGAARLSRGVLPGGVVLLDTAALLSDGRCVVARSPRHATAGPFTRQDPGAP